MEMVLLYNSMIETNVLPHDAEMCEYLKYFDINQADPFYGPIHVELWEYESDEVNYNGYYFEGHCGMYNPMYIQANEPFFGPRIAWTPLQMFCAVACSVKLSFPSEMREKFVIEFGGVQVICNLLLKYGADPLIRDAVGNNCFDITEIAHGIDERNYFAKQYFRYKYPLKLTSPKNSDIIFQFI